MKISTYYKSSLVMIAIVGIFGIVCPVYAYNVETLVDSTDFYEIKRKENEMLNIVNNLMEEPNQNLSVDYSRAVKVYVNNNIFVNENLSIDIVETTLEQSAYIWEVPVKVSDGAYVICTVSRIPPIEEDTKKGLLDNKFKIV